jgi:predicted nucleic acid-binding protein
MIFLDANIFLRYLVEPDGPDNQARHDSVAALFAAIELGDEAATTSEAVLAEVAYLLASKRQYDLPTVEIAAYLAPIIRLPGLRLPRGRKRLYLRALEIWSEFSRLGFVDALTAATVERSELRLATFDTDFDSLPDIRRWHPVGAL